MDQTQTNPMMNMNMNMMHNPFLNMNNYNYNINQNVMNPNMNNMNIINPNMFNLNMNQMNNNMNLNQINEGVMGFNQINDVEDIFPYIDEPKKILKFSNISTIKNGKYITVKIPNSITKRDLYSIARKYQVDIYSNIILSCNNYLLLEDDTLIEGIEEGTVINIIEDIDFPDGSFYKALMKKHENAEKKNLRFNIVNENSKIIEFPKNITVSEMMKAAFSKLLLNSKSSRMLGIPSDNSKINQFQEYQSFTIYKADPLEKHWRFGKKILATVISNNKIETIIQIGTLNSITQLIKGIELSFSKKLKKLYIREMEYGKNDIKSLKSIGIDDNFLCKVELGNEFI